MESHERPTGLTQEAAQQVQTLKQEVAAKSADQVKADFLEMAAKAAEMKRLVENTVRDEPTLNVEFKGTKEDKASQKGKAASVKEAVQKILLTAKNPEKIPSSPDQAKIVPALIKRVAEKIDPEKVEIPEIIAPYLYEFLQGVIDGKITSIDALAREFESLEVMAAVSPGLYRALQGSLVNLAIEQGESDSAAKEKFKVVETEQPVDDETRASKGKQQQPVYLSPSEDKRLGDLEYQIHRHIKDAKEKEHIFDSLREGVITSDVRKRLLEVEGFTDSTIEDLAHLVSKTAEYHGYLGQNMAGFEKVMPEEEKEKFTYSYLKENGYLTSEGLSDKGKRMLKRAALGAVNRLFETVDYQPAIEFEKSFSEFHEGYHFRDIQRIIIDLIDDPRLFELGGTFGKKYNETSQWLKEGLLGEVGREKELRSLYHNVGIWIKMMSPEQLSQHMATHNVSEATSVVVSDISGKLVALAMSEYERYMQFDISKNNGRVKPRLFAGKVNPTELYYSKKDDIILRERFMNTVERLKRYANNLSSAEKADLERYGLTKYDIDAFNDMEKWEIDRALKYAKGIHLTQTIRGYEVVAASRPPENFEGSADNFYDLAANLNPSWRWDLGRGLYGIRLRHTKEILTGDMMVRRPKESLWARIFDSWKPAKLHYEAEKFNELQLSENWAKIEDSWLYKDMNFRQLLSKFSATSGLYGRGGWRRGGVKSSEFAHYVEGVQASITTEMAAEIARLKGFKEEDIKSGEKFGKGHWTETYKALAQIIGVGSRFWFDGDRADEYVKHVLWDKLGKNPKIDKPSDLERLWYDYTEGKRGGDTILTTPDGEKMTVKDLMEVRTTILQGMNFHDLLLRSPIDFLNNLTNVQQHLMTKELGGTKEDFFFQCFAGDEDNPRLNDAEGVRAKLQALLNSNPDLKFDDKSLKEQGAFEGAVEKVLIFQRELKRYWGENNFKHIKYLRDFYQGLEDWGKKNESFYDKDGKFDKDAMFEFFFRELDVAGEKVKLRKGEVMKPEDIEDKGVRDFFFGEFSVGKEKRKGLVDYFKDLKEDFGEIKDGKDLGLGERGFFYHMARSWYNEIGTNIHPNTSDVDWRFILHNIGDATGESLVRRLWGDMSEWNKVFIKLMDLDHILARAATTHSLDEIMELHKGMHGVEGISGKHAMNEAQFYLAQLVARYFQQDSGSRTPFLLGSVYGLFAGRNLSLSRIHNGMGAMTLTSDGMNAYFQKLRNLHFIPPEGQFGFDRLAKTVGADWKKLIIAEMIPDILAMLALFLGWKFISKALEEAEGRKK